ncbi:hypothetical protein HK096_003541 [Nowakowskiella sp. JEL0078]|nr:hypothetical protein HK096_003541 [Nowakowskiella sp. JEL0078]
MKVAIVTGGNAGLGFATVEGLARSNIKVYMASRNEDKAKSAIEKIKASNPSANVLFLKLDLSDWKQTKSAAQLFLESEERLDILVNNAGIFSVSFELNKVGFENVFATNHIGHFIFTQTLLPALERSAPSRVVIVASKAALIFPPKEGISFNELNDPTNSAFYRYGQSKLANILYAKSLAERCKEKEIWVNCLHPGFVATDISLGPLNHIQNSWLRKILGYIVNFMNRFAYSPEEAVKTQLYAAISPEIEKKNYRGEFFVPIAKLRNLPETSVANRKELRDSLWDFTERTVNEFFSTIQ